MHGWRGDELASSLVFTLASGFDISEQSRGSVQVDICARELYVSQIRRYREHVLVYLIVTGRGSFQRSDGPAVAKIMYPRSRTLLARIRLQSELAYKESKCLKRGLVA